MFDTQVTVVGNLVAEPRLSFTKDGQAVASFRLASTPRRFDRTAGEWRDGDTLFTSVTCWRALAENVSASLKKGSSVIVLGRLSVRPYETKEGDKRQSVDIDAIAVGTDLGRVITIIKRAERGIPIASEASDGTIESSEPTEVLTAGGDAAPGATDWGWSGSSADPATVIDDDDEANDLDDETVVDDLVMPPGDPESEAAPPAPQLAGAGGRWRSRG